MPMTKQNALVLSVALLVSIAILYIRNKHPHPKFAYQVFQAQKGWGYDILVNDSLVIHQENMPVISLTKGFDSKEQAEKTALLVIKKLQQNNLPTLTKFEMEQVYPERTIK
jgi:Domain of unknown function (DUF4907)